MYVYIYMYVTTAYCHQKEKITTKEDNVRYWLGEHLLEVYSVHQHGEGELIEKETIEMKKKKKNDAHRFIMMIEQHQCIRNGCDDFFSPPVQ